jgi:integrase
VLTVGYSPQGKLVRKSVSAKTRAEVVRRFKVLRAQYDSGAPLSDTQLTVVDLLAHWYRDVLRHQVAPNAAKNYKGIADQHIVPTLGRLTVARLTVLDVDRLLSQKLDDGLSVSTVQRIRSVLAQALDQGIRWGSVTRNVARLSRAPKSLRPEGRTLTPDEARRFLAVLDGRRNEVLFTLMLATGLRRGEALGLQWPDFDEGRATLSIRRQLKRENGHLVTSDTKTLRSRRTLNISRSIVKKLQQQRRDQSVACERAGTRWVRTGFIFTSKKGTPLDPTNVNKDFQLICDAAGLGRWHPHELRHSAASLMLAQGVKLQVVSEVLGHSSIRMTSDVYGHILAPDREVASEAMEELLWHEKER